MRNKKSTSERRKTRSRFVDQALGLFLDKVRRDSNFEAIVLADWQGHLVSTSADSFSDASLEALGSFSVRVRSEAPRSCSTTPPIRPELEALSGENIHVHAFTVEDTELMLTTVGKHLPTADHLERIRAGTHRILTARHDPG